MSPAPRLPLLLTAYGLPYTMGYIPLRDGTPNPRPLSPLELVNLACDLGVSGIELPLLPRVPSFEGRVVELPMPAEELGARLREQNLKLVADYGVVVDTDAEHLIDYLKTAKQLGARVVRATLSNLLCGDRRPCPGGWPSRLEAVAARLREVLPHAEALSVVIAMENHQDATTDDLLRLADMVDNSPAYGITFDTGNPLAMAESPVDAARRLAPYIRHLHLKDYTIHFAPQGYRLVRCASGDGVIDFPAILNIVQKNVHELTPGIEIAAQATRTIPLLDEGWWSTYPVRPATNLIAPLRILWAQGRPADAPYSSAWERNEPAESVVHEEWVVLQRSVDYFRTIVPAAS